jgi:hypothetical protein
MRTLLVWSLRGLFLLVFAILLKASYELYPPIGAFAFNMMIGGILIGALVLLDRFLRTRSRAKFLRESKINTTKF